MRSPHPPAGGIYLLQVHPTYFLQDKSLIVLKAVRKNKAMSKFPNTLRFEHIPITDIVISRVFVTRCTRSIQFSISRVAKALLR